MAAITWALGLARDWLERALGLARWPLCLFTAPRSAHHGPWTLAPAPRDTSPRRLTIYLDACFSGDSPKGRLTHSASNIGLSHVPERAGGGITVITAARGDQLASWDEEAQHGLFTRYLLENLYGAANGEDYGNGDGVKPPFYVPLPDRVSGTGGRMFRA